MNNDIEAADIMIDAFRKEVEQTTNEYHLQANLLIRLAKEEYSQRKEQK